VAEQMLVEDSEQVVEPQMAERQVEVFVQGAG
jgi:hypothetical protein